MQDENHVIVLADSTNPLILYNKNFNNLRVALLGTECIRTEKQI